jgi:CDGSH-type Zn-finger protein
MNENEPGGWEPVRVAVEAGKTYWWCSCGRSARQPFCDGSHRGSEYRPLAFTAERDEVVAFCRCKRTRQAPRCDGSHRR